MTDLDDLYQELILDHYRRPRNYGRIEDADSYAEGNNPLCGDRLTVFLNLRDDVVADVRFEGAGCAISTASASIMTEAVMGKTREQAETLFRRFHALVTGEETTGDDGPELGKLQAFAGVGQYPARVKCATLAWHAFDAALNNRTAEVTTE